MPMLGQSDERGGGDPSAAMTGDVDGGSGLDTSQSSGYSDHQLFAFGTDPGNGHGAGGQLFHLLQQQQQRQQQQQQPTALPMKGRPFNVN